MSNDHQIAGASGKAGGVPVPQDEVLRYFMQSASLPVIATDASGRLLFRSPAVAELLQIKTDEVAAYNLLDRLGERDRSILSAHLDRVLNAKQPARCEVELVLPDHRRQWVRFFSHPGAMDSGAALCWSTLENITQLRRLEKTEALYQRAAEIISKAESMKDFSRRLFELLRILFGVENGYVAMYDGQRDQISFPYFIDKKDPYPEPRKPTNGLTDFVIVSGRMLWLRDGRGDGAAIPGGYQVFGAMPSDWIGVPLTQRGRVVGMAAIQTYEEGRVFSSKDIGLMLGVANLFEVFLARVDLEQRQRMLSEAVEQADETIVITDLAGVIQYVNPAFERKTGFTRDQAVGRTMSIINSGKQDKAYYREMWNEISSGNTWRGRFINRKKDGTLYEEEAVISPIRNKEGEIISYVAVKRDLTRESALERQFLQSRKMEVVERLVDSITHDFSNLMMIVRSGAEEIRKQARGPAAAEADRIIASADRGDELIRNLSAFSGRDGNESEVVGLNNLLLAFKPIGERLVGERNEILLELAPRMDPVRLSRGLLEQVLSTLLLRAGAASGQGGTIHVRTLMTPLRPEDAYFFVDTPLAGQVKCAVVEIADHGDVIPAERLPALFARMSGGPAVEDFGLVREIMMKLKGYIGVKENLPTGMVFRLYFPVSEDAVREPVALAPPPTEMPRGRETILFAEDDEGARRVISRMLQDQGYTVVEAENGAMAVRSLLSHPGRIQLLLTDMMMPDFDGRALAEQIEGLQPGMKVVFVSGYSRSELEANGVLAAGSKARLLKKPFKREELLQVVRQTLDEPAE